MVNITEKRSDDKRGHVVKFYKDVVEFAHYVFTYKGYARGGSSLPYSKDVTVCFGKLLCIGLTPMDFAREYKAKEAFFIPSGHPTLIIALEDTFTFTNHHGIGEGIRYESFRKLKDKINSGEDLEAVLKEFGIVRS